MPITGSAAAEPYIRRRAQSNRPAFFSRGLFRYPGRRPLPTFATVPSSEQHSSSVPEDASLSSSFLHRYPHRHHHNPRENQPKPIYIYPGLLRIVREKAIALDNQCPAVLYKCRECRRDQKLARPVTHGSDLPSDNKDVPRASDDAARLTMPVTTCPHQMSCAICLEEFHSKDLVRKLPCNANHVFHSKCILDWFISKHRCPLCNEPVTNTMQARNTTHQNDGRRLPVRSHRSIPELEPEQEVQTLVQQSPPNLRASQNIAAAEPAARDQSRGHSSVQHHRRDGPDNRQKPMAGDKGKKKQRRPRTYSYIVHDKVRMEMNRVISV